MAIDFTQLFEVKVPGLTGIDSPRHSACMLGQSCLWYEASVGCLCVLRDIAREVISLVDSRARVLQNHIALRVAYVSWTPSASRPRYKVGCDSNLTQRTTAVERLSVAATKGVGFQW